MAIMPSGNVKLKMSHTYSNDYTVVEMMNFSPSFYGMIFSFKFMQQSGNFVCAVNVMIDSINYTSSV